MCVCAFIMYCTYLHTHVYNMYVHDATPIHSWMKVLLCKQSYEMQTKTPMQLARSGNANAWSVGIIIITGDYSL